MSWDDPPPFTEQWTPLIFIWETQLHLYTHFLLSFQLTSPAMNCSAGFVVLFHNFSSLVDLIPVLLILSSLSFQALPEFRSFIHLNQRTTRLLISLISSSTGWWCANQSNQLLSCSVELKSCRCTPPLTAHASHAARPHPSASAHRLKQTVRLSCLFASG